MNRLHALALLALAALFPVSGRAQRPAAPPPTPRVDTTETLHGIEVTDPYRWLEDAEDEDVQDWITEQNAWTRGRLEASASRAALRTEIEDLLELPRLGTPRPVGALLFRTRHDPGRDQPLLLVSQADGSQERVLVDPLQRDAEGTTSLDYWFPSPDGQRLAFGLSVGGDERSAIHMLSVADGSALPEVIAHAPHASIAWLPDASGFFYTRMPAPGEVEVGGESYHQAVYMHFLGEPVEDDELVYRPERKEDRVSCSLSTDGRFLVLEVFRGWSESYLLARDHASDDPAFFVFGQGDEATYTGEAHDTHLYVLTNKGAPRGRVLRFDLEHPSDDAVELIPEAEHKLESFRVVGDRLVVRHLVDAHTRLSVFDRNGESGVQIPLPEMGTAGRPEGKPDGTTVWFAFSSFTRATTIFRYDLAAATLVAQERVDAGIDPEEFVVRQVRYASKDGTRIPMFLVHRRDLPRDGNRPVYLTGYGGFDISMTPRFLGSALVFLRRGGVYALPNLRGGGEYGEDWHEAGMLGNKQNVFDDFVWAARWLWRNDYTHPGRIAIAGGSNGGLLVAAAMTQYPTMFSAVVCAVPLTDMIRYHRFSIARLWIPEYGSAEDAQAFSWLHAYSPVHRVRRGVAYPAAMITAGANDGRVDPMHACKLAASLQWATASTNPIYLRVDRDAGHGSGKPVSMALEDQLDRWCFVFDALGLSAELGAPAERAEN